MPLCTLQAILEDARRHRYAVGCYNAIDSVTARGIICAAEKTASPVILCHAQVHFPYTSLEQAAVILLDAAEKAEVPVAVMLDHGYDFDQVMKALRLGYNAVMYDASSLSYQENLTTTAQVVQIAHAMGCHVEAELGHVTRPRSGSDDGVEDDAVVDDINLYTQPDQAIGFLKATGVDALAVAFGTAHGQYIKKPKLDLVRLSLLREKLDIPLVMHGGSGLSDEDYQAVIERGITKINYYTGMAVAAANRIQSIFTSAEGQIYYHQIMMAAIDEVSWDIARSMRLFGCAGKANNIL